MTRQSARAKFLINGRLTSYCRSNIAKKGMQMCGVLGLEIRNGNFTTRLELSILAFAFFCFFCFFSAKEIWG